MDKEAVGIIREAVEAAFEDREGWRQKMGAAVRALDTLAQQPAAQAVGYVSAARLAKITERHPVLLYPTPGDDEQMPLYAAPQPSAQQAEQPASKPSHYRQWSEVIKGLPMAEQPTSLHAESVKEDAERLQRGGDARGDCAACGGTGDVSGEYPGVACSACGGSGRALLAAPAAAEAQHVPAVSFGATIDPLAQAAHSRQAQGGVLSDAHVDAVMATILHWPDLNFRSERQKCCEHVRAILALAASEPRAEGREAELRSALMRLERAVDIHLGRSSWTQTARLKGLAYSDEARKELYAAHDAARAALAAQKKGADRDA